VEAKPDIVSGPKLFLGAVIRFKAKMLDLGHSAEAYGWVGTSFHLGSGSYSIIADASLTVVGPRFF
jgi:hypothetical protein